MTIQEQIAQDLKTAMLQRNEAEKSILKVVLGGINQKGKTVGDEEAMMVIKKTHSGLKETLKLMKPEENTSKQDYEISVLDRYLPKQLTEDQLSDLISKMIENENYTSIKEMGKIMGKLKAEYQGQYDGNIASVLIRKKLS